MRKLQYEHAYLVINESDEKAWLMIQRRFNESNVFAVCFYTKLVNLLNRKTVEPGYCLCWGEAEINID